MAIKKGICKNVFNCTKADANEVQEVDEFQDFICSECHQPLVETGGNGKGGKDAPKGSPVKKILAIGLPVLIVAGGATYFLLQGDNEVKNIRLSSAMQELLIGDTDTLKVTNTPVDATTTYIWTSDNENVAKVDANGVVTMTGKGKAVIKVTAMENAAVKDSCTYLVTERESMEPIGEGKCEGTIDVKSIAFVETTQDMQLEAGEEKQLHIDYVPENADETITWRSEDINIATVNDNGTVKAMAPGSTTITAVTNRTGTSTSIIVTVKSKNGKEPTGGNNSSTDARKLDLGFAIYEGSIRNGKPEGNGTMTFKKKYIIPGAKDDFEAQAGEYAIGRWHNGKVNVVTLYQKNGNQVTILQK